MMKRLTIWTGVLVLAGLVLSDTALAQPVGGPRRGAGRARLRAGLAELVDANQDGEVTAEEIEAAREALQGLRRDQEPAAESAEDTPRGPRRGQAEGRRGLGRRPRAGAGLGAQPEGPRGQRRGQGPGRISRGWGLGQGQGRRGEFRRGPAGQGLICPECGRPLGPAGQQGPGPRFHGRMMGRHPGGPDGPGPQGPPYGRGMGRGPVGPGAEYRQQAGPMARGRGMGQGPGPMGRGWNRPEGPGGFGPGPMMGPGPRRWGEGRGFGPGRGPVDDDGRPLPPPAEPEPDTDAE